MTFVLGIRPIHQTSQTLLQYYLLYTISRRLFHNTVLDSSTTVWLKEETNQNKETNANPNAPVETAIVESPGDDCGDNNAANGDAWRSQGCWQRLQLRRKKWKHESDETKRALWSSGTTSGRREQFEYTHRMRPPLFTFRMQLRILFGLECQKGKRHAFPFLIFGAAFEN